MLEVLAKTKNSNKSGPDGIPYRLIKLIKDTPLGQALINDIAVASNSGVTQDATRDMNIVMIPKPNKDHTQVKGWRPIVLANTSGKLQDKIIANKLQRMTHLFHPLQYGSRQGRSAIDALMITIDKVEKAINQGKKATLLGLGM